MSALYFHIPFCRTMCSYCDFHRSVMLRYMPRTIEAMHCEMDSRSTFITDRKIRTMYFGGGTPSLLDPGQIERFIDHARETFDCDGVGEITVEVNPDDVTDGYVSRLRSTSVNRISVGIQSLDDGELRFMHRRHDAAQAIDSVRKLQDAGYCNISADVIFGVEGFDSPVLERTIEKIINLEVGHVSAYHLSVEPHSEFGRMVRAGSMHEVTETESDREFRLVHDMLSEAGFEHYEVSNYARRGMRSRHNASYWDSTQYLGIGPGAHSFNGIERVWCDQSPRDYSERMEFGGERLTDADRVNEYLMTRLRTSDGMLWSDLETMCHDDATVESMKGLMAPYIESGKVVDDGNRVAIRPEHFLVSDMIIGSLFVSR